MPEANTLPTINMVLDKTGAGLCPELMGSLHNMFAEVFPPPIRKVGTHILDAHVISSDLRSFDAQSGDASNDNRSTPTQWCA